MAIMAAYPIVLEENADLPATIFTYYPNGLTAAPFDWTGWTAQMMIRANAQSVSPVLTLTIALGGAAGTVIIPDITAAQATATIAALPGYGVYDIVCTQTATGFKERFVDVSPVLVRPGVTK